MRVAGKRDPPGTGFANAFLLSPGEHTVAFKCLLLEPA
jgi:hypothetical protein